MPRRVTCLIVDDLEENLLALSALLQRRNDVNVISARSGAEALELLLVHDDVALALIDVQMPDMDGFDLAELMRGSERTRHVPIIFVTAGVREPYRVFMGYESGAVDFLYKPIDPLILDSKASVFFELYRQRLRLSEELRQRTETLRFNETFMAAIGHDLRDPLNAIHISASILQDRATETRDRDGAARILASCKRMGRMIEDMLDLTRARLGGGLTLRRGQSDLKAVLDRVVHEHAAANPERTIKVSGDGDATGEWDADRLAQVVSNLIGNALQHGTAASDVEVTLDGTRRDEVVLIVRNAGTIPPDVLVYIFDPFRSGERRSSRRDGLGLGLYISQQIAEAHAGTIAVESGHDASTVFRVTVPRKPPAQ